MNASASFGRLGRGLHGQLVHQLGQMIVSGDFDGPLATEDICERFEVSRTVVREALRVLEAKGLISARPYVGTRAQPAGDWNLLDPEVVQWRALGPQASDQYRELCQLRWAIEPAAAHLTASKGDVEVQQQLSTAVKIMDRSMRRGDPTIFARADAEFHTLLVQASGSLVLKHVAGVVSEGLKATVGSFTGCDRAESSLAHHEAIVSAFSTRDGARAEEGMRALLAGLVDADALDHEQRA